VKTDRLERNRDLNLGVPAPRPTDPAQRPIFPARPLTSLASVQVRESTASSEYTAMTLSSRLRRDWGLISRARIFAFGKSSLRISFDRV
jgi:hypothetical protein